MDRGAGGSIPRDDIAHRHDVGGNLSDVHRLDSRKLECGSRSDSDAVADDQNAFDRLAVHDEGPVPVPHVTHARHGRPGHREAVGHQPVVNRLLEPFLLHEEDRSMFLAVATITEPSAVYGRAIRGT